jgi:predicted enzyme related to lactoylglutathione lyase
VRRCGGKTGAVDVDVLFAGVAVSDFETARAWYERFFGRSPDVVAHDEEVMWQATDRGWLYIVRDMGHAGNSIVAMAVDDIEAVSSALGARGINAGPIAPEGDAGLKAVVRDPDGNSIALLQVAARPTD